MSPRTLRPLDHYRPFLGRRHGTLELALGIVAAGDSAMVVELGTSRSFVPGGVEGCLSDDPAHWRPDEPAAWDWGSGLFTRVVAEELSGHPRFVLHSVDVSASALSISRVICAEHLVSIRYHHQDSESFLNLVSPPIDLLYMDTGEADAGAELLHLREARLVVERELIRPGGVVLVDDVDMPAGFVSKGALSIPYLEQHGFEVLRRDYQVVLRRSGGRPSRRRAGNRGGSVVDVTEGAQLL